MLFFRWYLSLCVKIRMCTAGCWQLVNAYDGVPRVPLLLGYSHVEHAVYLDPTQGSVSSHCGFHLASAFAC
jgi:hypothetical protein